jgi:2,3-bisphosphoglycerate-dependent phosphoglycerate mutase
MKRLLLAAFLLITAVPVRADVALHTAAQSFEVGSGSFIYCFFSTVSVNLEPSGWGSRFPVLMKKLYEGNVRPSDLPLLKQELITVQSEFKRFPPSKVVWDFEHRDRRPPWGDNISTSITDLSNYFVTSDGKDLFQVFLQAVTEAERAKSAIQVR